ncbi:hypothetical protein BFW01_g8612 [Lasiodiplodia theobromae]|uniref:Uncharacterized protein n=1 Tax=Lasiodiplodia theobromae TaxID=45133 RepID=A0A5N5D3C1_9PEZI|nr:uncharacterized protein LTHEOB_5922 [Lasiodiplodia theobromae]KAB2572071.1 hypothetical protein DBV05_g9299 [Lasiodiplodia theobromae]KAF4544913.1 hypothetical protein LTHEOB_5922 [Lasiodiplodia theobromae]KAF9637716.1 hypothetical protein BFW01_g8612 [Lasiodiplodia theobromae]
MRTSTILLAATGGLAPLASAGWRPIKKDMLISPRDQRPFNDLPIRVADGGSSGFLHVQFPIECSKCFPADPSRPKKNLQDGVLEIDFRITRTLGLDGDEGAQVNGYTVSDIAFPINSGASDDNIASALRLFVDGPEPDVAPSVPIEGTISFDTVFANGTHDVKGVAYNLTKVGEVAPGAPTGFRLSYMRAPQNSILRIERNAANIDGEAYPFEHPELWVAVGTHDGNTEHFAWRNELDWLNPPHARVYPGWDQEFVNCKTTACRVNKIHTKVSKAYDECVLRAEHPDQFEGGVVPPGCYILLAGYYGKRNIMWVGCAIVFSITQLLKRNMEKQKKKTEEKKKQVELDEQMLDQNEDDIVSYMMEVEAKAQAQAAATGAATEGQENVKARKAHKTSDE